MLAIGRFTIRSRLERSRSFVNREGASQAFKELLLQIRLLQPSGDEIVLATEMEEEASLRGCEFDTGESQLLALLIKRDGRLLITGDKRAIRALHATGRKEAEGRVGCFEQLLYAVLLRSDPSL